MSNQTITVENFSIIENLHSKYLEEAPLYFKNNIMDIDQKRGLSLHGPVDSYEDDIQTIRVGIISDSQGIQDLMTILDYLNENSVKNDPERPFTTLTYPGFVKAFRSRIICRKGYNDTITNTEISNLIPISNPNIRIRKVAELYSKKVNNICDRIEIPDLMICHKPTIIEENFGRITRQGKQTLSPKDRKRAEEIRKKVETHRILAPLDKETEQLLQMIVRANFRRILKSKVMKSGVPIQILNQSTLEALNYQLKIPGIRYEPHRKQHPSTIAWNLSVALYYKANHFPWRVGNLKRNSCYIGIAFFYDKTTHERNMFASLAQIFSDTGEGMIVRGDSFHWDTEKKGSPQLSKDSAQDLLQKSLALYKRHNDDQPPNKIIIHKTSKFAETEIEGFKYILKEVPRYDFLTISKYHDYFFYRNGENPVLRGTFIQLPGRIHLLFTSGYVPYLQSYNRPRIPKPLEFLEHYGDSTAEELGHEIIALTRLDWNTTRYSSDLPMTLKFARRVGDILCIIPQKDPIQHQYRFYM